MYKLFTVCTEQVRSPYTEHAASGLTSPTHLEGEVRFDQAQDQQVVTTRSPRIVTESLLTRSEGEVRFDQAQDQQVVTTRSPRIVTESLLT